MGKGGGGGGPPPAQQVTSTTTTSNLPEYAKPYFENLMQRAQAESYRPYTPYEAERLAGFTPGQMAVQRETMGLETPGQLGVGSGMVGAGGLSALGAGQQYFGMATDPRVQQAFMSPYMQNVVDTQKAAAIRDAQLGQLGANLGAARQGTYGGARQLLAQTERERALSGKLGEIQATGSQKAFEDAQRAIQFGSDFSLRGLGQGVQAGTALGQLGTAQQQADIQRLQAQELVGSQQRDLEQRRLDQQYADFLRQRDYPMEQLGYYSNIMRGIPVGLGSTQTTYAPPPSIASQVGGLGLAGLSIGKMAGAFADGGEVAAYAPGGAVSSPEELDSMTDRLSDQQLQMQLRTAVPGTPEHLMVAGELQARKTLREKANVPQANPTPVIADLLTNGAMPQMPQMPPQMQQQVAMLPENAGGVAALPAPNMENVETMAAGGLVAFEDGGRVAQFSNGGTPFYAEGNRPFQTAPGQKRRQYTQEELDEARRLKELGVLGGLKEFVVDPVTDFFSRGSGRQDIRVAQNQAAYGQNAFAREGDPSGAQYSGIEDVPFSNMAPVAAAVAPVLADAAKEADAVAQTTDAAKKEAAGAGIPKLGDALALGRQFAGDTKGLEKQLTELPTAEKSATEQFDLYKKMGVDLDPYKALKESLEKEKSEEGKAKTQAGLMALANFGFSLATQTGPLGQALGKAGKETLPMYAAELKDLKKLSRERDRTLADIRATDSKMRKDVTDAGLAKLEKRREKLEGRIDQINDNAARISGTIYGQQLASQTSFGVANIGKTTAEAGRAEARDDRLLLQAQELAAKQVRDDPLNANKSAAQKETEIKQLASSYYRQLLEMRGGKVAPAPAGATLRFDAKGNPIQ